MSMLEDFVMEIGKQNECNKTRLSWTSKMV